MKTKEIYSPNWGTRTKPITTIVLHSTGTKGIESPLRWLTNAKSRVSAHYVVGRDGEVYKLVPVSKVAWHAGKSTGPSGVGVNAYSVGIEIVGKDSEADWTPAQIETVKALVKELASACPTIKWLTTHAEVAEPPGRKTDPRLFPVDPIAIESGLKIWRRM